MERRESDKITCACRTFRAWSGALGLTVGLTLIACGEADAPPPVPAAPTPTPTVVAEPSATPQPTPQPTPAPNEPHAVIRITPGEMRRQAWLESSFPCRAISTTRYRPCRFVATDEGRVSLRFGLDAVTCDDVEFGSDGDPVALNGCHSSWLRIPRDNRLTKVDGDRDAWAGSQRGWSWTSDGERYCCPGMWIMAPDDLPSRPAE